MPRRLTKSDWTVPALLVGLSLVPAIAGTARVAELASDPAVTDANARFVAMPLPVVLHIVGAIIYSVVGAFQFSDGVRRKLGRWHRRIGMILLPCGVIAATTGLWMAHNYAWPAGDGVAVYVERLLFGAAMLLSLALAVDAIRRRQFAEHGEWMMRAYAIGLGAGTQVLTHLPWFIATDARPGEAARGVMMGAGWIINVLVAEVVIRRRRGVRQPARRAVPRGMIEHAYPH